MTSKLNWVTLVVLLAVVQVSPGQTIPWPGMHECPMAQAIKADLGPSLHSQPAGKLPTQKQIPASHRMPLIFYNPIWTVIAAGIGAYLAAYPNTVGGEIFTFSTRLIGLGVIAVPTGLIDSVLSKAQEEE